MRTFVLSHTVPTIVTYPDYTNLFFALGDHPEVQQWLLFRTIGLMRKWDPNTYGMIVNYYDTANLWYCTPAEACPYIFTQFIDESVLKGMRETLAPFLVSQIKRGYYINLCVDNYELTCYRYYRQQHFNHSILLYGYDTIQETFNIAGFINGTGFDLHTVSFAEVSAAMLQKSEDENKQGLFFRYNDSNEIAIGTSYCSFLHPYNMSDEYLFNEIRQYENETRYPVASDLYMGLRVYDLYKRYCLYLSERCEESSSVFKQALQVVYSHKIILKQVYLHLCRSRTVNPQILQDLDELINGFLIARNSLLKYSIGNQMYKAKEIIQKLVLLEQKERETIAAILAMQTHLS